MVDSSAAGSLVFSLVVGDELEDFFEPDDDALADLPDFETDLLLEDDLLVGLESNLLPWGDMLADLDLEGDLEVEGGDFIEFAEDLLPALVVDLEGDLLPTGDLLVDLFDLDADGEGLDADGEGLVFGDALVALTSALGFLTYLLLLASAEAALMPGEASFSLGAEGERVQVEEGNLETPTMMGGRSAAVARVGKSAAVARVAGGRSAWGSPSEKGGGMA